ncbi:MAG TPA: phosphoribosylformylglycinamidine cyclo-ligase, partial [Chromatiales bacterium]|nr:phosphoribosylformylglycinamidine cyclo-ligase [Chromatiales bacterium]
PDLSGHREPVLVAGTDGVGTKLRLAIDLQRFDTVGIDLVAMCVNDVIVQGAEPLFFLDYYATGQLDLEQAEAVIRGIAEGCRQANTALLGGETAEMPGMYEPGDLDLAGFCVGIVDRGQLIDGSAVTAGQRLLGLASSGAHSNGYSLIRRVLERSGDDADTPFDGATLGERLIAPTKIYVKAVLSLLEAGVPVSALAHITGGGLTENLARVLPDTVDAHVDTGQWTRPAVFDWLQQHGNIDESEMRRTFNCGIGMVVVLPADHCERAQRVLEQAGETVFSIGDIRPGHGQVAFDS